MTNIEQLLAKGRKYGKDIPHLVNAEDYEKLFDPEQIEDMELMKNGAYIELSPKELEVEKARLRSMFSPEKEEKADLDARTQISLRLYKSDIEKLKALAKEEGMPYQTLITSILHKVANKKLITTLQ